MNGDVWVRQDPDVALAVLILGVIAWRLLALALLARSRERHDDEPR